MSDDYEVKFKATMSQPTSFRELLEAIQRLQPTQPEVYLPPGIKVHSNEFIPRDMAVVIFPNGDVRAFRLVNVEKK